MDLYIASVLVFIAVLAVIVYKDRKKFKRDSIILTRRTSRGKGFLIRLGTMFPRGWKVVGFVSVLTGLFVSFMGIKLLVDGIIRSLAVKAAIPNMALVVPSLSSQAVWGYGFLAVPFWYWIICIALLVLVHEGFHGIFTAREKVKIKSLGVGLLAIIPLAFVEPDEKELGRRGVWPQLRVFSAGSFANFLLAGITFLLLMSWLPNAYMATGVIFGSSANPAFLSYSATEIELQSVRNIGNFTIGNTGEIGHVLMNFDENQMIEIRTENATFYIKRSFFESQLNASKERLVVFEDYPAAKAGLVGVIKKIDDHEIRDHVDMTLALEKAGPGKTITITTEEEGEEMVFSLTTAKNPNSAGFSPDEMIYAAAALEHVFPGTIELYHSAGEAWARFTGQRTDITWAVSQHRLKLWNWVLENYPLLETKANERIGHWEDMLSEHPKPGFLGISSVATKYELKGGLAPFKEGINFTEGLLLFLIMINLGVGIVNLLPIKPLDGGRMWDVILKRYVPKRSDAIMRAVTIILIALFIANFIPFGAFV